MFKTKAAQETTEADCHSTAPEAATRSLSSGSAIANENKTLALKS